MKKFIFLFVMAASLSAVAVMPAGAQTSYGKSFKVKAAQTPQELMKTLETQSEVKGVVVKGTIAQVCQAEGCWMKLKNTAGEDMMVKFKDHAFLVPKDIAGKSAVVYGTAKKKTVSVDEQRHLAEDAGQSSEEIAAITTPRIEVRIDATGVVVE
jgi:hypothetical protein